MRRSIRTLARSYSPERCSASKLRGSLPSQATGATVLTDTNCNPDALGVSHCYNDLRLANGLALAITFGVLNLGCALLSAVVPQFLFGIAVSWAHSVTLTPGGPFSFGSFLYGFCTFVIFGYITGIIFVFSWNSLAER